jgi:hypothetical protein
MRIQLLLPKSPRFSSCNAFLAAQFSCSHKGNVFTGFIVTNAFYSKMALLIIAGSVFSIFYSWQSRLHKLAPVAITRVFNVVKLKV